MESFSSKPRERRTLLGESQGALLAFLCLLALASCGGGGGGGDDDPVVSNVVADFAATCSLGDTCSTNSVLLEEQLATGDVVTVEAVVNRLNTTIGEVSLLIQFDPTVADYMGFTPGSALGSGNQCPSPPAGSKCVLVTQTAAGELLVDILPSLGGASVSQPDELVTLSFKALRIGTTNLTFIRPNTLNGSTLYDPGGAIIGGTNWNGGTLVGS